MITLKLVEEIYYDLDLDGCIIDEITKEEAQRRQGRNCRSISGYDVEGGSGKRVDPDEFPQTIFRDKQVHVIPDFKTKEDLKKALAAGETVHIHDPSGSSQNARQVTLEGPHGPIFCKWYVSAHIVDSKIVKLTPGFWESVWKTKEVKR